MNTATSTAMLVRCEISTIGSMPEIIVRTAALGSIVSLWLTISRIKRSTLDFRIHGSHGLIKDYQAEKYGRDARFAPSARAPASSNGW